MSNINVQSVAYEIDGVQFEGQLVFSSAVKTPRPALLMAPNWMGVTEGAIDIARKVAGEDYVVFIADLYGKSLRPSNADEAASAMMPLKDDRALLRKRMQGSLRSLLAQTDKVALDTSKQATFGFCFGGCCSLELARDGAPLQAAISFHGTLDTPTPADANNIKGSVLVLDGAADPLVPREQLAEFAKEMTAANVDWQLVTYGGAVHSFTDPHANVPGTAQYDEKTAARAFTAMRNLLDERFAG